VSTLDETTDQQPASPSASAWDEQLPQPAIGLALELAEAEALRAWLLKATAEGATSLDDPHVSRVLSKLGVEVDEARAAVNVRRELVDAGFSVAHLSDDQLRELGGRIAEAAAPGPRA
jgi:ribosomal protein L12E/L44/L45/RPP1/RPP2